MSHDHRMHGRPAPSRQRGVLGLAAWAGATVLTLLASLASAEPAGIEGSAADLEFFESKVRPLLIENCSECHGADTQWADMRVDSRDALLKGGESGPTIVPGDPEKSLLIAAVRYAGDLQMPPDGKLDDQKIAILEQWVALGAPWPAGDSTPADAREAAWRQHWAFQPIKQPAPPTVSNAQWVRTPVDAFILSALDANGLAPAPQADRRTLIRRVTYDLTGLPPTPAEVEAFVDDVDPEAYAKLVERLLQSPHYGEHWARHWLDVARYSDTKGYVYGREERYFVHSAAYRDWVVRALNDDMPYDKFLVLQLAADQAAPGDPAALAAMGFLTLGRRFLGVNHDIIDDRIDVVARGTLGLTVACARCHDHKYDPIPTADYYSMYGLFLNSAERLVRLGPPKDGDEAGKAFEAELQTRRLKLHDALATARHDASTRVRQRIGEYLTAQLELEKHPEEAFSQIVGPDDIVAKFVRRWEAHLKAARRTSDPVFAAWHRFAELPAEEFAAEAAQISLELQATEGDVHPLVARAFAEPPASMLEVAKRYGDLFTTIDRQWQELLKSTPENERLADDAAEELRQVLYGAASPCVVPEEEIVTIEQYFDTGTIVAIWQLQGEVDRWINQYADAGTHGVALYDRATLQEPRIFRRGNPAAKGDEVPRQFLKAVSGDGRQPFSHGSGRLEFAQAVVDPSNPLTARVWANRVWMHHFGAGLVRTPSDFGMRAEPPTHPELLDWLAQQLLANGWSTKSLHRQIVLSATYQQASAPPVATEAERTLAEHAAKVDPENRLLARMNVRRLGFEEWRDTLLEVSGELDHAVGGRAAELFPASGENTRRTLYGLIDRQFLNAAYRTFDFANPDLHVAQRSETTVSQQALFAMNHPFVGKRARQVVAAFEPAASGDPLELLRRLYAAAYQRAPTEAEQQSALEFLAASASEAPAGPAAESLAWSFGYGEVLAAEGRVTFEPLPHFNGAAWQGGAQWPDAGLGWVQLTANGGHAGNDLQHAAVRRWTAPRSGQYRIKSTAEHAVAVSDGIRCWIVSSRQGVLKSQAVLNASHALDVDAINLEAGDTIDFAVDFNAELNSDQYVWKATIEEVGPSSVASTPVTEAAAAITNWDSARDFTSKQLEFLEPWHQLAQVLLLANEVMFVD